MSFLLANNSIINNTFTALIYDDNGRKTTHITDLYRRYNWDDK
ncbi:MAG: hypothetical protein ACI9SI_001220, partial [Polaribacter sp.]